MSGETQADGSGELGTAEGNSGDAEGETGAPPPSGNALGLTIAGVSANQGTQIPIATGSAYIGGAERNARLVGNRDTLIRGFFNIDEGWIPRDIECRLHLEFGDGTSTDLINVMTGVSTGSHIDSLDSTCNFFLDDAAGHTAAGTKFQLSFHEVNEGAGAGLAEHATVAPADAPQDIGFEGGEMVMKIKLVPILYQNMTAPLDANLQLLSDAMFQQNPLSRLDISIREPVSTSNPDLYNLLQLMQQTKAQDGAPNNEYYFAFVNTGQQWGAIGLAPLGGTVAAGLWLNSAQLNSETFVHEVGHDQNLGHVECPDFGMPPFEPYSDPNGYIVNTGYGIINGRLYTGYDNFNYMTYCGQNGNQWASDWNWGKVWDRIAQFTAQGDDLPVQPVLQGMVGGTSEGLVIEDWWTANAVIDDELLSGNEVFRFQQGELDVEVLGEVRTLSDSTSLWISVPLPEGFEPGQGTITRVSQGQASAVVLADDKLFHDLAAN